MRYNTKGLRYGNSGKKEEEKERKIKMADKKYRLILGNLEAEVHEPEDIRFWIENEIGAYEGKAKKAEEWCKQASIGDVYDDEFIHIEVMPREDGK